MVGDSFAYAKEAVVGKWNKWVMLIIATILLVLPLMGYALKVLRGEKPAPEVEDWGTLFIDGIKYHDCCDNLDAPGIHCDGDPYGYRIRRSNDR